MKTKFWGNMSRQLRANTRQGLGRSGKWALLALTTSVLVACGGGGGSSPSDGATERASVSGELTQSVLVATSTDLAGATVNTNVDQTGLELANTTGQLGSARTGQFVHIPPSDNAGLPLGLLSVVEQNSNGILQVKPAQLNDVFNNFSVNYDSARDGAQVTGLVSIPGGRANWTNTPAANQSGLDYISCQLGVLSIVGKLECEGNRMSGTLSFAYPAKLKIKGDPSSKTEAEIYGKVEISDLIASLKIDYDKDKYAKTHGVNEISVKLSGTYGGSLGIKLKNTGVEAEVASLVSLLGMDQSDLWDAESKLKWGKYFELSGIDSSDKKGLIPIAGIYVMPNLAVVPKVGGLSELDLKSIKALGMVMWFYMDLSGNIVVKGDVKFLDASNGKFSSALLIKPDSAGKLQASGSNDIVQQPTVLAPKLNGDISVSQKVGMAAAVDFFAVGVRPVTLKLGLLGTELKGSVQGSGAYQWNPAPQSWQGDLCVSASSTVYSDLLIRLGLNLQIDSSWFKVGAGKDWYYKSTKDWWERSWADCINSYDLQLTVGDKWVDADVVGNTKVELSFADAYNTTGLRNLVGHWQVGEDGPTQSQVFDASTAYGGRFTVSRPPGTYKFIVLALHKDLKNSIGDPVIVAQSAPVTVTISAAPTAEFTAGLVNNDCKQLRLTSTASAASGKTISAYEWTITPSGDTPSTKTGSSATHSLNACGPVAIVHKVTDSAGIANTVSRSINTSDMAPKVGTISPSSGTVNTTIAFTISGSNLPLTAVLEASNASCLTPTGRSSTGFGSVCTFTSTGNKTLTVRNSTGGSVIDTGRSISISSESIPTTSKLPHSGITPTQCYAAGSSTLVACSSTSATSLNNQQDGHRAHINAMSYSKIGFSGEALADNASSWCAVKDNITGLLWQNHQSTPGTYTNYGSNSVGDASKYTADNATLCGLSGWRLPTVDELQSIVDYSKLYPGPTINTAWFANTPSHVGYWTSSPYVGNSYYAWSVYFSNGYVGNFNRNDRNRVRLVRASQ